MPLTLTAQKDHPLCHGHSWKIVDETLLINLLTRIITGYHRHVSRILREPTLPLSGNANSLDALIRKLGPPTSDATRYHRDGWVFQMISWIAAHKASNARILIAPPQPRPADKGFDGLIIELADDDKELSGVIICEDKASEHARQIIESKVWPELLQFESGARDAELQSEVTSLLETQPGNIEAMIEDIHWKEKRKYRVSVTIDSKEHKAGGRQSLFKGYEKKVSGKVERRQGEHVIIDDIRNWMDELCEKLIAELYKMPKGK